MHVLLDGGMWLNIREVVSKNVVVEVGARLENVMVRSWY